MVTTGVETGPKPLSPRGVDAVRLQLHLADKVRRNDITGDYFSPETGIFTVDEGRYAGYSIDLWCEELMGLDPKNHTLRIARRGVLLIQTLSGEVREPAVEAANIRLVQGSQSGLMHVHDSGFLLAGDVIRAGKRLIPTKEFQQVLADAEQGIKPRYYDLRPFTRVDPNLSGQDLHRVAFMQPGGRWNLDAVVIREGQLVSCKTDNLLSPSRWTKLRVRSKVLDN